MGLKIIKYDGTEIEVNALSFEFRTNQVTNWILLRISEEETMRIHDVCVIKTLN